MGLGATPGVCNQDMAANRWRRHTGGAKDALVPRSRATQPVATAGTPARSRNRVATLGGVVSEFLLPQVPKRCVGCSQSGGETLRRFFVDSQTLVARLEPLPVLSIRLRVFNGLFAGAEVGSHAACHHRTNRSPLVRAFCLLSFYYALRSGSIFLASDWRPSS